MYLNVPGLERSYEGKKDEKMLQRYERENTGQRQGNASPPVLVKGMHLVQLLRMS